MIRARQASDARRGVDADVAHAVATGLEEAVGLGLHVDDVGRERLALRRWSDRAFRGAGGRAAGVGAARRPLNVGHATGLERRRDEGGERGVESILDVIRVRLLLGNVKSNNSARFRARFLGKRASSGYAWVAKPQHASPDEKGPTRWKHGSSPRTTPVLS